MENPGERLKRTGAIRRLTPVKMALIAVLLLSFLLSCFTNLRNANWIIHPDDHESYVIGKNLRETGHLTYEEPMNEMFDSPVFTPPGALYYEGKVVPTRAYGFYFICALGFLFGPDMPFFLIPLFGLVCLIFMHKLCGLFMDEKKSLLATMFFAMAAPMLYWANMLYANLPGLAFLTISIYFLAKIQKGVDARPVCYALCAIFLALAIWTRYEYAMIILPLIPLFIIRRKVFRPRYVLVGFLLLLMLLSPIILINNAIYGNPFSVGYTKIAESVSSNGIAEGAFLSGIDETIEDIIEELRHSPPSKDRVRKEIFFSSLLISRNLKNTMDALAWGTEPPREVTESDEGVLSRAIGGIEKIIDRFSGPFVSPDLTRVYGNAKATIFDFMPMLVIAGALGLLLALFRKGEDWAFIMTLLLIMLLWAYNSCGGNLWGGGTLGSTYVRYQLVVYLILALFAPIFIYRIATIFGRKAFRAFLVFFIISFLATQWVLLMGGGSFSLKGTADMKGDLKRVNSFANQLPDNAVIVSSIYTSSIVGKNVLRTSAIRDEDKRGTTAEYIERLLDDGFEVFLMESSWHKASYLALGDYISAEEEDLSVKTVLYYNMGDYVDKIERVWPAEENCPDTVELR